MREIEEAAKPIVSQLMVGRAVVIDTFSQRLLSAFLCLVSMRVEFGGHMRAIPKEDHDRLRTIREPSTSWWIAISHYKDQDPHEYWFNYHGMRRARLSDPVLIDPVHCNTQVTTLVAGKMCAHMFSSTNWEGFCGYEGFHLTQVWPPRQLDIDARFMPHIDNVNLAWVHEAVARDGMPPPKQS
jgi:hypothetical protein